MVCSCPGQRHGYHRRLLTFSNYISVFLLYMLLPVNSIFKLYAYVVYAVVLKFSLANGALFVVVIMV